MDGPHAAVAGPQCLAADGTPLDWWVALKLPGGNDLAYLDSVTAARMQSDARFKCGFHPEPLEHAVDSCRLLCLWLEAFCKPRHIHAQRKDLSLIMRLPCIGRYIDAAAANTSLSATLLQLYAQNGAGEPAAGAPGHLMYSDEPPLVDPLGNEDFYAYSATQGRGVLVRQRLPAHCMLCPRSLTAVLMHM